MSTALDFRDILQHPPAASKAGEPLPADPSWDTHKVYFNERERQAAAKGDEFDDFFAPAAEQEEESNLNNTTANMFVANFDKEFKEDDNNNKGEEEREDTLDPLGWPVDAFRSIGGRVQSILGGNNTNGIYDDDDGDGDDLNLLNYKSDDYVPEDEPAATGLISSLGLTDTTETARQMMEGVEVFLRDGTCNQEVVVEEAVSSDNDGEPKMAKEERIKMYETTGDDDESSVEEDNREDDEEWEKDRDVGYVAQSATTEEEDAAVLSQHDNNPSGNSVVPDFAPVTEKTVPTFKIPFLAKTKPKKKKNTNGVVPMIRPPPPEKLKKWEDAKAKQLKHVQAVQQKGDKQT